MMTCLNRVISRSLFAAVICLRSVSAQAEDNAQAEQLFEQARALMQAGEFTDACPKLEASYKLDPATGTLFNLAHCYEQIDRLASAWAHYLEVADRDSQEGRNKRAKFARERAQEIEPRIPRLTIVVPGEHRVSGLAIERNGQPVADALFDVPAYLDMGEYEIVAMAPEYKRYSVSVEAVDGQELRVEIPALERDANHPAKAPARVDDTEEQPAGDGARIEGEKKPRSTRRTVGLVLGGAGLATALSGLGLGWWAKTSWDGAFDDGLCERETLMCTSAGQDITGSARARADMATVLLGVGAAAVVTGVVLYLTAPKRNPAEARVTLTPAAGNDRAGLVLTGSF